LPLPFHAIASLPLSTFFITLGGPKAHDSSGRDDNAVVTATAMTAAPVTAKASSSET
jgi:hypothetical protein